MLRRTWMANPALAIGVLLALPAGAQGARDAQAELADALPVDGMTREHLVGLYASLAGVQFEPPACVADQEMFTDVPASNLFCPWIEELARRGITSGCTATEYCPGAAVSRSQMAAFLVRSIEAAIAAVPEGPPGPLGPEGPAGPQGPEGPPGFAGDCNAGLGRDDEMVRVGSVCIDKYEASIWDAPVGGNQITGTIPCSENGQDCDDIYARSVAGVEPRGTITWYQAQAALANSGKRLPTNAEWQMAVRGTPDDLQSCNMNTGSVEATGSRIGCVSAWGSFDMVGNLWEWVADWVPFSTDCPGWGDFSDDFMCLSGASTTEQRPGALVRGGSFHNGTFSGPFSIGGQPISVDSSLGFRGAR